MLFCRPCEPALLKMMQARRSSARFVGMIALLLFAANPAAADQPTFQLTERTLVRFATKEQAGKVLGAKDSYTKNMSAFDRAVRLKSSDPVTTDEFLKFATDQARAWSSDEVERFKKVFQRFNENLAWVSARLPEEILIIKTSKEFEGGNPHTRAKAIVMPENIFVYPDGFLQRILVHEIFHVISRNNPQLRNELFSIVGFKTCNNIKLPANYAKRILSNPDAPGLDVVIELKSDQKTGTYLPVLLSTIDKYDPSNDRPFPMGYLDFKFAEVEMKDSRWQPKLVDGDLQLINPRRTPDYYEKIGRNTQYIIHPEEVLADNFVFIVLEVENLPSPHILESLRSVLTKK